MVLVMLGQQGKDDLRQSIYFFEVSPSTAEPSRNQAHTSSFLSQGNTTNFTSTIPADLSSVPDIPGTDIDNQLLQALRQAATTNGGLADVYRVGLWNYCAGNITNNGASLAITYCSPRTNSFWFNPIEVWGLNGTAAQDLFPAELTHGLEIYQKVAGWMFTAYIIALCTTAATILMSFLAILSRWGSLLTTLVQIVRFPPPVFQQQKHLTQRRSLPSSPSPRPLLPQPSTPP